jgi:type III pantothenate kinase
VLDLLLAVDIGNTHIKIGVYEGGTLRHHWRLNTRRDATADETALLLQGLLDQHEIMRRQLTRAVVASVVPSLTPVWQDLCRRYLASEPLLVTAETAMAAGLAFDVDRPSEVGADRIVNALAALEGFGAPVLVVDLGTATKVEAVGPGGVYLGGPIAPGVVTSADALVQRAARLFRVELVAPPRVIGRNTVEAMQAGIVFGSVGLVDALVERVRAELGGRPPVVATGGLAALIAPWSRAIDAVDPLLTLAGLRLMAQRVGDSARPRQNMPRG